jgi:DNA polymerase I (EC 2.7.7.7)
LGAVERHGVLIDPTLLNKQSGEFEITLRAIEEKVYHSAQEEFNLGSPKQLQEILFEKLGLPVLKKHPKVKLQLLRMCFRSWQWIFL